MSTALHMTIATPAGMLVDAPDVVAFRAEDASGSFGVLPGHTDFLTALSPCVVRWSTADGTRRFCAVSGGVLRVIDGKDINIACRDGELGDALETLEARVRETRESRIDATRRVRVEQTRLNAQAIRQILKYLRPGTPDAAVRADGTNEDAGHER
ncbi:F0F1 ATP synthase subunit epsilon [Burkholderia pyrrocinia]|uniref:F0F1 ATP synthase subunit epsilon n=1 Tax=Burkholderia pyrrocinia TaxID=60550 RepID=UPI00158C30B1|nr:F0F1 ATP synthase subunit epsilon [Burkholderia pyrrocinia]